MTSVLKIFLKSFLWMIASFVILFFLVAGLIQLPSIQNHILKYAISYVSDKTKTKIEIKNVSISFPKSIVIEGLFLEDKRQDTLLCAGKTSISISFKDLIHNKLNFSSFRLEDAGVNLYRKGKDSQFNYNFLITAFSDTTSKTKASSPWTISLSNAELKHVKIRYLDDLVGLNVSANIQSLSLDEVFVDPQKQIVNLRQIELSKSQLSYRSAEAVNQSVMALSGKVANEWKGSVKKIDLEDNTLEYQTDINPGTCWSI